ncbi:[FeFe] hydrogenase H-cluster maturation GTPase HydF [Mycoplasma sp. P36-A1]|uniref:[FeFe] hydrogenase H-cluster maturation GTPase HydF n=1 Tax=Mycoplasma sp. P36-A1 TaxID=3252900 RepID=UPI003C2E571A
MDKIPSLIPTIVFIGQVNAGKSSIINKITKQEVSIVSEIAGTTTDEVVKRFELLDAGPVNIIDTAGLNDNTNLAEERNKKTEKAIKRANIIVYVFDATKEIDLNYYNKLTEDKIMVFNKIDLISEDNKKNLEIKYPKAIFINKNIEKTYDNLLIVLKSKIIESEKGLLDGITLENNLIVHVIPVDSEAPKGRLILPQMQLIRECLDKNIISIVLKETELEQYLNNNTKIGLIVTDSQAFKIVSKINNKRFPLTSYSILQANQKGDLNYLVKSLEALKKLEKPHILMMESCSHNSSHEDIGRVKIPKMLKVMLNDFTFDFKMSHDFPENLKDYDFILHCGSCMLSETIMMKRINMSIDAKIPMSNYGLFIAYFNGILSEAIQVFK